MKRGWITWDKQELPPEILKTRIESVRDILGARDLPALVVYTDIWRSNWGRYLSNFMPYWNRSLLVIPRERPPILLCALSPRVYPWIRSVTILEDIRPSPKLADNLMKVCAEYSWECLAVLDLDHLPQQIYSSLKSSGLSLVDISSERNLKRTSDPEEFLMCQKGISISRRILETELAHEPAPTDFLLAGRLERAFRRSGIEDLVLLFSDGSTAPAPARGAKFNGILSVVVAAEYRGSWVRLARSKGPPASSKAVREQFEKTLGKFGRDKIAGERLCVRRISGSYPYEYTAARQLSKGSIFSVDVEIPINGSRLFYGDTCRAGKNGAELL